MAIGLARIGQLLNPGNYLNGATDCVINGDYAYVVSKDEDALVIIDISNKTSPSRVGQITGAGNYLNFVRGVTFVVDSDYVYAVSKDSDAFVIIDVSTKSSPTRVGQLVGAGEYLDQPTAVKVVGNYAYVTGTVSDALVIIDISNKTAPVRTGQLTGSGNWLDSPQGLDVSSDGIYAYVCSNTQNSLAIINCSNKTSPVLQGHVATAAGQHLDGARGVVAKTSYAYVCSESYSFAIINITNKSAPSVLSGVDTTALDNCLGLSIDPDECYAFIAAFDDDRIGVIDIRTKGSPSYVANISGAGEYLDGVQSCFYDDWHVYTCGSVSDSFVVLQFTPNPPNTPLNIACVAGIHKNDISWDASLITDWYNLYWMKYEFFPDTFTSLDAWDQYKDVGTETIEINSDKLRFSNSSGTGCHVVDKIELPIGDFQIDIDIVTYTPDDSNNGHLAIFRVVDVYPFSDVDGVEIYYYQSAGGATHNIVSNMWINGTPYNVSTTAGGQPEKLRILRDVTTIKTYYYYSSTWTLVDSRDFSTRADNLIIPTIDSLQNSGNGGLTEFDNFDFYVDLITLGTKIAAIDALVYEHTSLDVGDNYIYAVTAENPGGESGQSAIVGGVPEDSIPGTLTISGYGDDSQNIINISNVINADSIDIYYSLSPGVTKTNGIKLEDVSNPYYHIDLTIQNYYYIAIANNVEGESAPSNEICLRPDFQGKIFDHTDQIKYSLLYQYQDKD